MVGRCISYWNSPYSGGVGMKKHVEPHVLKVSVSIYNPAYNKDFPPKIGEALQRVETT